MKRLLKSFPYIIAMLAVIAMPVALVIAQSFPTEPPIVGSWNKIVRSIEKENDLFHALEDSYRKDLPGAVAFTPDARAEKIKSETGLIDQIIALHKERIALLEAMKCQESLR
jgi:hypothetical protein